MGSAQRVTQSLKYNKFLTNNSRFPAWTTSTAGLRRSDPFVSDGEIHNTTNCYITSGEASLSNLSLCALCPPNNSRSSHWGDICMRRRALTLTGCLRRLETEWQGETAAKKQNIKCHASAVLSIAQQGIMGRSIPLRVKHTHTHTSRPAGCESISVY